MVKNMEVERLRAVAILLVLNSHLTNLAPITSPRFSGGIVGVELFFVISGYVICKSLLKNFPDLSKVGGFFERLRRSGTAIKVFYTRRFFRIFPLVIFSLLLNICFSLWDSQQKFTWAPTRDILTEAFDILTLRNNYTIANGGPGSLGVFWSLMVEEHFYLLFPLALVAIKSKRRRIEFAVAGIFIVAFIIRGIFPVPVDAAHRIYLQRYPTHRVFDGLLAGVLIALLNKDNRKKIVTRLKNLPFAAKKIIGAIAIAALCFGPSLAPDEIRNDFGIFFEVAFSFILVFLASMEGGFIFEWPGAKRVLEYIGSRSFGLYVIHGLCFLLAQAAYSYTAIYFTSRWQALTMIYVSFVIATLFITEFAYRLIERPLIARGARISNRMQAVRDSKTTAAA